MQDTKNLKRKIKEYRKQAIKYRIAGDFFVADYWATKINDTFKRIEARKKNKLKNEKQFKKAN